MVVSGSHVAFLETVLVIASRHCALIRHVIPLALLLFAVANRLEAVVVRAVFSLFFRRLNERFRFSWGDVQILCMSGLLAMGFCKGPTSLLSLSLSWLLGLALLDWRSPGDTFLKNVRAYAFIAPGLLPFSLPHPASILCNFIFAPFMGLALFPASLLTFLVPNLAPLTDWLWRIVKDVVRLLASYVPPGLERCEVPLPILLTYITVLTALAWHKECRLTCARS